MKRPLAQSGAALLQAMLTVTLVATFAAAALWQQWRSVEVEAAERARVQSAWILIGATDWARLILRLDAQSDAQQNLPADHLAEPWAVPLAESRLSSFLAADKNNSGGQTSEEQLDAFLSGQIGDLQARLNLRNLVDSSISQPWYGAFAKLFKLLGLPEGELSVLADNLRRAWTATDADAATAPIAPQRVAQLVNYGLSPAVLAVLEPYVTLLSVSNKLPVNINTASAVVLAASEPALSLADAERARGRARHPVLSQHQRCRRGAGRVRATVRRGPFQRGHQLLRSARAAAAGVDHVGRALRGAAPAPGAGPRRHHALARAALLRRTRDLRCRRQQRHQRCHRPAQRRRRTAVNGRAKRRGVADMRGPQRIAEPG